MQKETHRPASAADNALHTLSAQLRQARIQRRMTQKQLAISMHVSRQTISNWENARSQPDYATLQALAAVLGLSLTLEPEYIQN